MKDALLAEVHEHDEQLARQGIEIWVGSEPTFTNARSQDPCWISEALGGEKEAHAKALLLALATQLPGPTDLLQVYGRLYPGETSPRFCYGALYPRYGEPNTNISSCYRLDLISATPTLRPDQAWLTVTPDPAVVEVNMAPAHDLKTFARWAEAVFNAANAASLSAERMRYNGDVTDSGGGGQITLGGPTPDRSPFFRWPQLLPGLVRYTNRHPSLSYYFASACCGSASQAPRADEGVRERFDELGVALDYLSARGAAATPKELWGTLSPLLVDAS
ncbi:MAG TPA: transglutaminase family protein, partial [Polyangiales bacterium]|nr:transglutaminase family protein [Polyangiales bacterium]